MLQCILHIQLVLFLGCMEYGASMPGVVSVKGMKQPYIRGCCEIYWLVEVLTNLDFVWLISGLGIFTLYFDFLLDFLVIVQLVLFLDGRKWLKHLLLRKQVVDVIWVNTEWEMYHCKSIHCENRSFVHK